MALGEPAPKGESEPSHVKIVAWCSDLTTSGMSEAQTPPPSADGSPWETVNFPGAASIDTLAADRVAETAAPPQALEKAIALIGVQMQRNRELLAGAMAARSETEDEPERIARLTRQLEAAEETIARQQALARSLTTELESQRRRAARLQRQRDESQQEARSLGQQLECERSSNRELRSRLDRQQRLALQFKAALEKALDRTSVSKEDLDIEAAPVAPWPRDRRHSSSTRPPSPPPPEPDPTRPKGVGESPSSLADIDLPQFPPLSSSGDRDG